MFEWCVNAYTDLVAKGLELDHAPLQVDREPLEVHVATDVEVQSLAESDEAVVEDLDGLGGIVNPWHPEARFGDVCEIFKLHLTRMAWSMKTSGFHIFL